MSDVWCINARILGLTGLLAAGLVGATPQSPVITTEPTDQSVTSGSRVVLEATVSGASPFVYQWQRGGSNLPAATNLVLEFNPVEISDYGDYRLVVSNAFGAVTSRTARVAVDDHLTFRILDLQTNGVRTVNHNGITGDDRGGVAVSRTHAFVTGDDQTARYTLEYLEQGAGVQTRHEAMVSDLRSGTIYVLGDGATPLVNPTTVTSLLELDGATGQLNGGRIDLSEPIGLANDIGIFAGYGRIVIHTGVRVYAIDVPSGRVADLGAMFSPAHWFSETWAYWGLAEYIGGKINLVYVQDQQNIMRLPVPGVPTVLARFQNLGDMHSIGFSLELSRWYFHHEGNSELGSGTEILGSAKALYTTNVLLPYITQEPVSTLEVFEGSATFTVTVLGQPPLAYQWRHNGTNIAGATNATLVLDNLQTSQAGQYSVAVGNALDRVESGSATLTVVTDPLILVPPQHVSVDPGTNVSFSVSAIGPLPLRYQWRLDGAELPGQTNAVLDLTEVQISDAGAYSVAVSNRFGVAISADAFLTVFAIVDDGSIFRILELGSDACEVVEHNDTTGNDRGGIAASSTHVFVTGDNGTGRYALGDLSGGTRVSATPRDGMVSNLRTETVYLLGEGETPLSLGGGTVTSLLELNSTGQLTGNRVDLNRPIQAFQTGDQVGLFSGYGRVVIYTGLRVWSIALPSGIVSDLGVAPVFSHTFSESWAFWGIAEHHQGFTYLVYVQDQGSIARVRLPDGQTEVVSNFSDLSDMASFTLSLSQQRWYFHYQGSGQFGGQIETLGYCGATVLVDSGSNPDRFVWDPIPQLQVVDVPFAVTLRAINTAGNVVTNFSGSASLSARHVSTGQPIQLTPTTTADFVNGVWTGEITLLESSPGLVLDALDSTGSVGTSQPVLASPLNDLVVVVEDQPDPVILGQAFRYHILVTNTGPAVASGVAVTNALPGNVVFQSVISSRGNCGRNGRAVWCEIGDLGTEGALITIEVVAAATGSLTNLTQVSRQEPDALLFNNQAITTTQVTLPLLRVDDAFVIEGDSGTTQMVFNVSLTPAWTNTVRVSYVTINGTAVASGSARDFNGASSQLIFDPGTTNFTVEITIRGDTLFEADEQFFLQLFAGFGAVIDDNEGVGTILNDDTPPTLTIRDASVVETDAGITDMNFELVLSEITGVAVIVDFATSNNTATAGTDFVGLQGRQSFTSGTRVLTQAVTVQVLGDRIPEGEETFSLNLLSVSNAIADRVQAVGTIIDNEGPGILDRFEIAPISSPQVLGQPFEVTVSALDILGGVITDFDGTVDLRGLAGQPPVQTNILGDLIHDSQQPQGSFTIGLRFTPTNNMIVTGFRHYSGTKVSLWTDDGILIHSQPVQSTPETWVETPFDQPVTLFADTTYRIGYFGGGQIYYWTVAGPAAFELGAIDGSVFQVNDAFPSDLAGTPPFTFLVDLVYLTGPPAEPISISPTLSGQFVSGLWTGTVRFDESSTNAFLEVSAPSGHRGRSERFQVFSESDTDLELSVTAQPEIPLTGNPLTYELAILNRGPAEAQGIVLSNSLPAAVNLLSVASTQGICDTNAAGWVVCELGSLSAASSITVTITVEPRSGGVLTNQSWVIHGGLDPSLANNFVQVESLVIQPALRIDDVSLLEGDSGTNIALFTVTLWPPSLNTVRVSYVTVNGTATGSGSTRDFLPRSGQLTFEPGTTNQTIAIPVLGDTRFEEDETFPVQLFGAFGAVLEDPEGVGTILNDDPRPAFSVSDVTSPEGQVGTTFALFSVILSASSGQSVTVAYRTVDGSARAGEDYGAVSGVLSFSAGTAELTQTVSVPIFGDALTEPDEQFFLELHDAIGADLPSDRGIGTIENDDLVGQLSRFAIAPITSPQRVGETFDLRVRALDGTGDIVTAYTGSVSLSATSFEGAGRTTSLFGSLPGQLELPAGFTYGFSFIADTNLLIREVKHVSGTKVSIWTAAGQLLTDQLVTSQTGTWLTTPLATPVALQQGDTYRIGVFSPDEPVAARTDLAGGLAHIRILQAYEAVGDAFPNELNTARRPLVDFVYSLGTTRLLAITPEASEAFENGVWSGAVSIGQAGRSVVVRAEDQADHQGSSSAFDVLLADDVQLTFSASDTIVILGQPATYRVVVENPGPGTATGVVVTNQLASGVEVTGSEASAGTVSGTGAEVVWELGNLGGGQRAELTLHVNHSSTGTGLTSQATVTHLEPDPVPTNNSDIVRIDVISPIANGSFETGDLSGWITQDLSPTFVGLGARAAGFDIGFNFFLLQPTDGNFAASHGYAGEAGLIRLAQDVFVPAQLSLLSFDYRVAWEYFDFGQAKEFLVRIEPRGGGAPLLTTNLLRLEATQNLDTGPLAATIDLSAYAGGSVRISFEWPVYTPFDGPGLFQLDAVRFERLADTPPFIVEQPQDVLAATGEDVSLGVAANGSVPLAYQWRRNGMPIFNATNASLALIGVSLLDAVDFDVIITNPFGTVTSAVARVIIDQDTTFQIITLDTTGSIVVDHDNLNGDDRGGIAVSATHLFVQGDGAQASDFQPGTALFNIVDLSGGTGLGRGYDALISDLRTETVYSLGNGTDLLQNTNGLNFTLVDSLIELGGASGLPTGNRINLSAPIDISGGDVGLFAGYGRVVIHAPPTTHNISLPSGVVTELTSTGFLNHQFSENWAYWGVAEFFDQTLRLVYVRDSTALVRTRLSDGLTTPILTVDTFPGLGDMASITFSTSQSRWYFHHETGSLFQPQGGETAGSAKASFTTDPGFPGFTQVPVDRTSFAEEDVTFEVVATGAEPLLYQWFFNGQPLPGQKSSTLFLQNISTNQQGSYHVEVSNQNGFNISPPAFLRVFAAPQIFSHPTSRAVLPDTNVTFSVSAVGALPLAYQWRHDGVDLPAATNAALLLTEVQLGDAGLYDVVVSNRFGTARSNPALLSVLAIVDDGSVFRITHLGSNDCAVLNHNNITGDDRGGIGASATHVFYTGDNRTGRFDLDNLGGGSAVGAPRWEAMVSDLRTETLYTLADGDTPLEGNGIITSLIELSNTGQFTGRRVDLSLAISAEGQFGEVGIFAGYGRAVIHNGQEIYSIALPSGRVSLLGNLSTLAHQNTESWAYWGVAEHSEGHTFLTYAMFDDTIVRTRLPDGSTTLLAPFQDLSDMGTFTVSLSRSRWYFHYENAGQFGGQGGWETIGYCDAQFQVSSGLNPDRFEWSELPPLAQVGVPFPVTITARTTEHLAASNFTGVVTVSGLRPTGGPPLQIATVSNFVDGVWTGLLTVNTVGSELQLVADDDDGHTGLSGPITISPPNDLALLVETRPDPVPASGIFSYLLTVTNLGPDVATGVLLTNLLPDQISFLDLTTSQGSCQVDAGLIRCQLGDLPANRAALVELRVGAPGEPLTLTNQTWIGRDGLDPLLGNNSRIQLTDVVLPSITISDASLLEGDSGTADMVFEVVLSVPRTNTVRVSYTTVNGTAIGSGSRADFSPRGGQLIFQPGVTDLQIVIPIRGDLLHEADEVFFVQLFGGFGAQLADIEGVGLILDDDDAPTLSIEDVRLVEGDSGITDALFQFTLSKVTGLPVPILFATSNGTARAGSDYRPVSSNITFQANSTILTQTVIVSVLGDLEVEPDEFFYLNLLSVSNAIVLRPQAIATIVGDDGAGFLDHFSWSPVSTPQPLLQPIPVTITARDVFGGVITDFNGTVQLHGQIQSGSASSIVITEANPGGGDGVEFANVFGAPVDISGWTAYAYDNNQGPDPAVAFQFPPGTIVPPNDVFLLVESGTFPGTYPEFRTGSNISWTHNSTVYLAVLLVDDAGRVIDLLLAGNAQEITSPLTPSEEDWEGPVVPGNEDGPTTYQRVGDFDNNGSSDWVFAPASMGTANDNLTFPFTGGLAPVMISPTNTSAFIGGIWTGSITVFEEATNMTFQAVDSVGHSGRSLPFDAIQVTTADLAVVLTGGPNPVPLGGTLSYSVLITNRGPGMAMNVIVNNHLPPETTLLTSSTSQGALSDSNGVVRLELGMFPARAAASLSITLQPNAVGLITNRVQLTTLSRDPLLLNNQAQLVTLVWLDTDGDGMSDAYEIANQFDPEDPSDADLDSDNDGQTNLQESRAGTNPRDANSVMRITSIEVVGNDVCIRFTGVQGRLYRLERREMETSPWVTLLVFRVGSSLEVKVVDSGGASLPNAIYRIELIP